MSTLCALTWFAKFLRVLTLQDRAVRVAHLSYGSTLGRLPQPFCLFIPACKRFCFCLSLRTEWLFKMRRHRRSPGGVKNNHTWKKPQQTHKSGEKQQCITDQTLTSGAGLAHAYTNARHAREPMWCGFDLWSFKWRELIPNVAGYNGQFSVPSDRSCYQGSKRHSHCMFSYRLLWCTVSQNH